jgi:hypothetical protein
VVTDVDTGDIITATLTLSAPAAGTLSTGTYGSATSSFNAGTGVWTVTGSVTDVNAALAAVSLIPGENWDQNVTITTQIRDAANTGPANGTISFDVTAVNDKAAVTGSLTTASLNDKAEGDTLKLFQNLTVSDVDTGEDDLTLTITLSDPTAGALSGATFASDAGGVYTLTGLTPAAATSVLDSLVFTPARNTGSSGTLQTNVTVAVHDGTEAGTTTISSTSLTINRVNDVPVITSNGGGDADTISFAEKSTGAVATVVADDPDQGSILTYSLSGADAGSFDIDATSGVLTFKVAPTYQSAGDNTYEVTVIATDEGTPLTVRL